MSKEIRDKIEIAVNAFCDALNREFPRLDFHKLTYESGLDDNARFTDRMIFGTYLEFIRAGIITAENCE